MIRQIMSKIAIERNKNFRSAVLFPVYDTFKSLMSKKIPIPPINTDNLTSYDVDVRKETENPLVRVYVLTYNNAKFAGYNLNGILMQKTDFPFEIYVYDDCSTDGTSDIIRWYAQKYPNITADISPVNYYSKDRKLWDKKQAAIEKNHNCKYFAIADGDDYWIDPYKLQYQVGFLEKNSDFSLCSGGYLTNNIFNGKQALTLGLTGTADVGIGYSFEVKAMLTANFTRVYRTASLPECEVVEKYDYWRDLHELYYALLSGKGCFIPRVFGVYNQHQGGIMGGLPLKRQLEVSLKVLEELYRETGDERIKKQCLIHLKRIREVSKNAE
ncbi:MAG: glycosyltransferase family 2 protein [Chitinispirillales bacterium]|nr:glycosyltransferase family 2 protein [Chitinispirillales bacterium]